MTKKVNRIVIPAAILGAVGAIAFFGTSMASATSGNENTLVDRLVSKFNLNKTEVQAVFDGFHQERDAERATHRAANLQSLVDSGKITAEQKTKIEEKFKELDATREAHRAANLTDEQRAANRETQRTALQKWAAENNIDLSLIMPQKGMGKGGMGGGYGMGRGGHGSFQ